MAHNLATTNGKTSFFYYGEAPWHGLGQKLDAPATAQEAITAAGLTGLAVISELALLLPFWCLVTLGGFLSVIVNAVAADLWPAQPRRGVLLLHGMVTLGKMGGPVAALYAPAVLGCMLAEVEQWPPWRAMFLLAAFASLAVLLLLAFEKPAAAAAEQGPPGGMPAGGTLAIAASAGLLGLISGSENALASVAPAFFQNVRGLDARHANALLSLHFAALAAGRFAFGVFNRRLSPRWIMGIGLLPAFLAFPAGLSGRPAVFAASFVLLGLGFSITWPTIFAHLASLMPHDRSRLTLAVGLANALGINACIAASSALLDVNPPLAVLLGPVVLVGCSALFIFALKRSAEGKIK